jgi:hypothetical protein
MSDASSLPKPDTTLRFRMRTLLQLTAIVAVIAAITGPFYRSKTPEAQTALVWFWSFVIMSAVANALLKWRRAWRRPGVLRPTDFVLRWTTPRVWSPVAVGMLNAASVAAMGMFLALYSQTVAQRAADGSPGFMGLLLGTIAGRWLIDLAGKPVFLSESGVTFDGHLTPWERVWSAEWAWSRTEVLRLRLGSGAMYAIAARDEQEAVEQYVSARANFLGRRAFSDLLGA